MARLVMIEDERELRDMLAEFLNSRGWEVFCAGDGETGLALVAKRKPDVVLLDVQLPDLDGRDVCARLKADPALKSIPVVLMSGAARKAEDVLKGLGGGGDDYVLKPMSLPVLQSKLEAVLRAP